MSNSDVNITGTWKGFFARFRWLLFSVFVVFALIYCGCNAVEWLSDDNSYEAQIEEALIAMDDGDYARARDILTALHAEYPYDATVALYLSNALAGLAGLDTLNFLEIISQIGEPGDIDMVGLVLGDANGKLTTDAIVDTILPYLEEAIDVILGDECDQKIQLGLLSLTHAALTIARIVAEDTNNYEIILTKEGLIDLYYPDCDADFDDEMTQERSDNISNDVENIKNAIDCLDLGNDINESFDTFLRDIDPNSDGVVDTDELENYLNNLCQSRV